MLDKEAMPIVTKKAFHAHPASEKMAKERCLKKTFQESLEDIKERMKEKRTRKLAKVATVTKALSTKVKIINNSSVAVKSFQENNKALALALETEKSKTRQALDLILHLKREHQRLMFEIFNLRRKLNMQQDNNPSESKLESLKGIIAQVSLNLLETAHLLDPAYALCSGNDNSRSTPSSVEEKRTIPTGTTGSLGLPRRPVSDARRNVSSVFESVSVAGKRNPQEDLLETSENTTAVNRLSKGRKSSSSRPRSEVEKPDLKVEHDFLKHVSIRRRPSSLNICIEEFPVGEPLEESQNLELVCNVPENIVPMEECFDKSHNDEIMETYTDPSPSKEEFLPFTKKSQILSSTPEPKPKQAPKIKNECRTGREKVRKCRADGAGTIQLKKPWEKSKPRARSKSRDRGGASKPVVSKDKMNVSLNSGDAYDFGMEESIHVMPFRQNKPGNDPEENADPVKDDPDKSSSSEEELNDSLYKPSKTKAKNRHVEKTAKSLPLRPRSRRNKAVQQPLPEETENNNSDQSKQDVTRGRRTIRSGSNGQVEYDAETKFTPAAETEERSKKNPLLPKYVHIEEAKQSMDILALQDDVVHPADRIMGDPEGAHITQRISLYDVTNLSAISETKKLSFPLSSDDERKMSGICVRKRRCTVTVNYAEPKLGKKLRRGDPFTDTKFLSSPIYKNKDPKCTSLDRKSLTRYNEAFVGCR